MNQFKKFLRFSFGFSLIFVFLFVFDFEASAQETSSDCALQPGEPYTHYQTRTVYLITEKCTKRPFKSSDMYFTYFDSWSEVRSVSQNKLNSISDDPANFVPYGPKYDPQGGALAKIPSDNRVYLLLNDNKYWITNEDVFEKLNYKWSWIQDIAPALLDKYKTKGEINYTDHHPVGSLVKYEDSSKVYRVSKNSEGDLTKRHIPDEETFEALGYRFDRIVTIPKEESYITGEKYQTDQTNIDTQQVSDNSEENNNIDSSDDQGGFDQQKVEQLIHQKINNIRSQNNLPTFSYDSELVEIARKHSQDMIDRDYFSHNTPDGKTFHDRYQDYGYTCKNYGGENIAKAQWGVPIRTNAGEFNTVTNEAMAEAIVQMWMHSTGHKQNILIEAWKSEGIGVIKSKDNWVYVTQNFC